MTARDRISKVLGAIAAEPPRTDVNRYARLGPEARALFDDHDALDLAEFLVKAHDELERARRELADRAAADSADAAAGSYANGSERAIANPQPWLHILFTSPDPTTANTSALNLRDHLAAEFDGVSMRTSSNADDGEGGEPEHICKPGTSTYFCPASGETESDCHGGFDHCCDRPDLHRPGPPSEQAEGVATRVTALYEQWVKAGPPPLGVSTARWCDRRLAELGAAINGPAEQPKESP